MIPFLLLGAALAAQDVTLKTADGVALHALVEPTKNAKKGVVLVHMVGRSAEDWRHMAGKLSLNGFMVVAPDLRKHGKNTPVGEPTPEDFAAMRKDVEASVAYLRSKGVTDVACAGASIGANLCLQAAAADPAIVNVVMLSPGLNYKGVTVNEAIIAYGDRPVLLVASNDDAYSARSAAALHEKAVGQKHLEALDAAGHGTVMLNRSPGLENTMVAWINGTFKLTSGELVAPRPAPAKLEKVETTGKKIDE